MSTKRKLSESGSIEYCKHCRKSFFHKVNTEKTAVKCPTCGINQTKIKNR